MVRGMRARQRRQAAGMVAHHTIHKRWVVAKPGKNQRQNRGTCWHQRTQRTALRRKALKPRRTARVTVVNRLSSGVRVRHWQVVVGILSAGRQAVRYAKVRVKTSGGRRLEPGTWNLHGMAPCGRWHAVPSNSPEDRRYSKVPRRAACVAEGYVWGMAGRRRYTQGGWVELSKGSARTGSGNAAQRRGVLRQRLNRQ